MTDYKKLAEDAVREVEENHKRPYDTCIDADTVLALVTAVRMLEKENQRLQHNIVVWTDTNRNLQAEIQRLREALEKIADPKIIPGSYRRDIARAALKPSEPQS